ncbi:pilus assembly protein PilM [Bacillaceae bacterium Marseille-Q3522]|nr:pilus assembly protein PilM [Bacillaceae bacterium Marseille-Q3522]
MSFITWRNHPVNLVINDHSLRFLEIKETDPPAAQKWGEFLLPAGIIKEGKIIDRPAFSNIITECVHNWKICRRSVRFLVPDPLVIIRKVQVPEDVKPDELKGYLYLEFGTSIHLPFDDPVFDCTILEKVDGKREVLLFAAPEEAVLAYSNILSDGKLKPIAADIAPLALYRLYAKTDFAVKNERLLMVQYDQDSATISIFEDHIPYMMHKLTLEWKEDDWEIHISRSKIATFIYKGDLQQFSLQLLDLFKEIDRIMDFYQFSVHQGNQGVTKILLGGDHPLIAKVEEEMRKQYEIPVLSIHPDQKMVNGKRKVLPQAFYLALGLGLKEVQ